MSHPNAAREHCLKAIAYVKTDVSHESDGRNGTTLPVADNPVLKSMGHGILATYVVDKGDHFEFVRQRDLDEAGLTLDELHRQAVYNLSGIAAEKVRVQPYGNIFAVLMGGNFESSLILFDSFWKDSCAHLAPNGYVAAFPARDILSFTDIKNEAGIKELGELLQRAGGKSVTHKLTNTLFTYDNGQWIPYRTDEPGIANADSAPPPLVAQSSHWRMHVPADWVRQEDKFFHMTSADKRYGFRIAEMTWQTGAARPTDELIQMVYDTDLKSILALSGRDYKITGPLKSQTDGLHLWETELFDAANANRVIFKHIAKGQTVIRGSFNDHHCSDLNESNAALGWIRDSLMYIDQPA